MVSNFSIAFATTFSISSAYAVMSRASVKAPFASGSWGLETFRAVATTSSPRASAARVTSRPRPVEQPVMNQIAILEYGMKCMVL